MNQQWLRTLSCLSGAIVASLFLLAPTSLRARQVVHFAGYSAGTVVVRTGQRRLYFMLSDSTAIQYPVGVGRRGMAWSGTCRHTHTHTHTHTQGGAVSMESISSQLGHHRT